ncbi:hypothetical protein BSKO_09565 [Bryopsis sp. KO-2023]|nr:hypothetical protein BSKO_09565 [Bryopsis sp. KO-2023]
METPVRGGQSHSTTHLQIPQKPVLALKEFIACGETICRKDCEERQVKYDRTKASVTLYGGGSLVLGKDSADEELFVYENSVIWSAGGVLRKKFSFDSTVHKACWCRFDCEEDERVLCVLEQNMVSVYRLSGELVTSPFSQKYFDMWPLPSGLILEGRGLTFGFMASPIDNLHPVLTAGRNLHEFFFLEGEKIIWSSKEAPYIVTHRDQEFHRVAVWQCVNMRTSQIPVDYLEMTPGLPLDPKATPSFISEKNMATATRSKARLSNGALSPAVFSHLPTDGSLGPFLGKSSKRIPLPSAFPIFHAIEEDQLLDEEVPVQVCMASTGSGELVIAILCEKSWTLRMFKLNSKKRGAKNPSQIQGIMSVSAVSPFAKVGTSSGDMHSRRLLVLTNEWEIQILKDGVAFCAIKQPTLARMPESDDPNVMETPKRRQESFFELEVRQRPVRLLKDAVGDRVSFVLKNGAVYRCSINLSPSYPLPGIAMDALNPCLGEEEFWVFFQDWLRQKDTARNDEERDWDGYCTVFHNRMGRMRRGESVPDVFTPFRGRRSMPCAEKNAYMTPYRAQRYSEANAGQSTLSRVSQDEADWRDIQERFEYRQLHRKYSCFSAPAKPNRTYLDGVFGMLRNEGHLWECLQTLHAVYEEFKLDMTTWILLSKFGKFLTALAVHVGADKYIDHYARDIGVDAIRQMGIRFPFDESKLCLISDSPRPTDIHRALLATLTGKGSSPWLSGRGLLESSTSAHLLQIYQRLFEIGKECGEPFVEAGEDFIRKECEHVVNLLVERKWDLRKLESLPFGLALPIREAIHRCKEKPPTGWSMEAYALIGRDDIVATLMGKSGMMADSGICTSFGSATNRRASIASVHTPGGPYTSLASGQPATEVSRFPVRLPYNCQFWIPTADVNEMENDGIKNGDLENTTTSPKDDDGLEEVITSIGALRFGKDARLREIRKLLCSATLAQLGSESESDDAGPEVHQRYQVRLMALALRTMALPVGRGAFVLGTVQLQPAEDLNISELCLNGRIPGRPTIIKLELNNQQPPTGDGGAQADLTAWPEFHNGAASGLVLRQRGSDLCRSWLNSNTNQPPSFERAGVILALGLTGHLDQLTNPNATRYLGMQHTATTIALLIGLGASKIGTMDAKANTIMFLHLPHRIPQNIPEVEPPSHMQAANLMALGLLYKGTSHRMMTALMLEEIGRRPGKNTTIDFGCGFVQGGVTTDREGYALAAGFALGLINLGMGGQGCGIDDMQIEDTLRYFMVGGNNPQPSVRRIQSTPVAPPGLDGLLGPGGTPWDIELRDMEMVEGVPGTDQLSNHNTNRGPDGDHAQVVLEGEMVNLDVTSPAATMALALMYIRSNNEDIAMKFKIPESPFMLDWVGPDFIMLRVLGRSLVLWDAIEPTPEWIQAQLPGFMSGDLDSYFTIDGNGADKGADKEVIAQAHMNAVAGACLAMGLKYAGTADGSARATLHDFVLKFLKLKKEVPDSSAGADVTYGKIDKQALQTVCDVCALALSVVMAGTGHLPTFRLLRALRMRLQPGSNSNTGPNTGSAGGLRYGNHMAIGMALGFLFLGGGYKSFRTDNLAVASLLISLFPKFPQNTMDQRCHLQAFRHMYVLASESRAIACIDVDTGESVSVPLRVKLKVDSCLRPTPDDSKPPKEDPQNSNSDIMPVHFGSSLDAVLADVGTPFGQREHHSRRGAGMEIIMETPCLLPEHTEVQSIQVIGPRYWFQVVDGSAASALTQVYSQLQIFVKKKSGMLSYTQDPLGVKTLLSTAFHQSMVMPSPQGGYDLVNLCATYSTNLSIMGFARFFCLTDSDNPGHSKGTHRFKLFCREVLYDCITLEKPEMLMTHVYLHSLVHGAAVDTKDSGCPQFKALIVEGGMTVGLWNLKFCRELYKSQFGRALLQTTTDDDSLDHEGALISPALLNDLWAKTQQTWDNLDFTTTLLRHFLETGEWSDSNSNRSPADMAEILFGAFLAMNDIPSHSELRLMIEKTKGLFGESKLRTLLPKFLYRIAGISGWGAEALAESWMEGAMNEEGAMDEL